MRFEPGQSRTVELVALRRRTAGLRLQGKVHGEALMAMRYRRQAYAEMYGPTVGDRVRLADTELSIEIETRLHGATATR